MQADGVSAMRNTLLFLVSGSQQQMWGVPREVRRRSAPETTLTTN